MSQLTADARWGLVVNEVMALTYGHGGEFWATYRPRFEMSGQLRVLKHGFIGELVELGPWAKEDAEFARGHMHEHGVPTGALKVRRWTDVPVVPQSRRRSKAVAR